MFLEVFLLSIVATFVSISAVRWIFPKLHLMDNPQKYGHARKAVPYPAGVIIPILFFSIAFFFIPQELLYRFTGYCIASCILVIVSFADDRKGLSPYFRLFIQFAVAGIIVASGIGIDEIRSPLGGFISLHGGDISLWNHTIVPLADTLAILFLVGMMNTMNWLDGISGLTSSVSAISAGILSATAYAFGQADIALLLLILTGILSVFFLFDLETPKILMGDSGSMFLGLSLGVFSIIAGGKVAIVMLLLFAPLFDAVITIVRRMANGVSPFKGDLLHLHHKILERIKSRRNTVLIYASSVAIFGGLAYFLETLGKAILLVVLCIFLGGVEYLLRKDS